MSKDTSAPEKRKKESSPKVISEASQFSQPEILALITQQGGEGYLIYDYFRHAIRLQTTLWLPYSQAMATLCGIAALLRTSIEKIEAVVSLCVGLGLLAVNGTQLSCPKIDEDVAQFDERRKQLSQAGRRGAKKRYSSHPIATLQPPHGVQGKERKGKDRKGKEGKGDLVQRGKDHIRMTEADWVKLEREFPKDQIEKQLELADRWITDDPKGSRYRKPSHNHYLFFLGWLNRNTIPLKPLNGASALSAWEQKKLERAKELAEVERRFLEKTDA